MDLSSPHGAHYSRDTSSNSDSIPIWAIVLSVCSSVVLSSTAVAVFVFLRRRKLLRKSGHSESDRNGALENYRIMNWMRGKTPASTCSVTSSKVPYTDAELAAGVEPVQVMRLELAQNQVYGLSEGFSAATTALPSPRLVHQKCLSPVAGAGCLNAQTAKEFRSILNMLKDSSGKQFPSCGSQEVRNGIQKQQQSNNIKQKPVFPALALSKDIWVERIMLEFWAIFDQRWTAKVNTYAGSGNSGNTSKYTRSASTSTTTLSSLNTLASSNAGRKRSRASDEDIPSEDEDGPPRRSRSQTRFPKGLEDELKLACPFRKHDPVKYSLHDFPVCALSSWDTIARLKEHLLRSHKAPVHCKRCWLEFKSQDALDTHITVPDVNICKLQEGKVPDGITPEIAVKLKSRKKASPDQSVPERWKDIYRLLFPDELVPIPYFERIQDQAVGSPESPSFEDYTRRELPRLFRTYLDRTVNHRLQSLDGDLKGELVNMIRDCQEQLSQAYRARFEINRAETVTAIGPPSIVDTPEPARRIPSTEVQQVAERSQNYSALPRQEDPAASWVYITPLTSGIPAQVDSTYEGLQIYTTQNEHSHFAFAQLDSPFANGRTCSCVGPCTCYFTTSTTTTSLAPSLSLDSMDLSEPRHSTEGGPREIRHTVLTEYSDMSWLEEIFERPS